MDVELETADAIESVDFEKMISVVAAIYQIRRAV